MNEARKFKFNFTESVLAAIKPPTSGRVTYNDLGTRGLQLRVSSSGVKTFSVYRWVGTTKRPERINLGRYPDDFSVKQARNAAMDVNQAIAKHESPATAIRNAKGEMTLGKLFEMFIERHIIPQEKGEDWCRGIWERYLGEMPIRPRKKCGVDRKKSAGGVNWQNRTLSSITRREISELHAQIGKKTGHGAANHAIALLKSMYERVLDWELFDGDNPAKRIKKFPMESRERFITSNEMELFFEVVNTDPSPTARDFVLLSLFTGQRSGNGLSMKWSNLDLPAEVWRIPGATTKNGDPITIPLCLPALGVLSMRYATRTTSDWVFPSKLAKGDHIKDIRVAWERMMNRAKLIDLVDQVGAAKGWQSEQIAEAKRPNNLVAAVKELCVVAEALGIDSSKAGLPDLIVHDLRRSLGSWMAGSGASTMVTAKALGHKSLSMARVYQRVQIDPVRAAMETATAAMLTSAGTREPATIHSIADIAKKKKSAAG